MDTETIYEVRNDSGRRFHAGPDRDVAIEVACRLEAQLRGVSPAGAVGGSTPSLADVASYSVHEAIAPTREAVADTIRQGVPLPGAPTGEQVTGNEVAERKAAELEARGATAAEAFGEADRVRDVPESERVTNLEPRPDRDPTARDSAGVPPAPPADEPLEGEALDARAAELDIRGRSSMSADEKRAAIAEAERQGATA